MIGARGLPGCFASLFLLASGAGCASGPAPAPRAPPPDAGELLLGDLEQRLLRAKNVHVKAHLTASGAVNADMHAELFLGEGNRARLAIDGTFEGQSVTRTFVADGARLRLGDAAPQGTPPEVDDALVIGLVRMGLLHNVAVLVGGRVPDHADGGVHNWVKVERAKAGFPARRIAFDIVVNRQDIARATLELDEQGRPVAREQVVDFDAGEMRVVEQYTLFDIDGPLDAVVFSLDR